MEKDEIIALFRELFGVEFGKAIKAGMPDLIQGVRAVIAEEAKPKLAFDLDIFRDLTTRATAVSPECHQEAVTMALEGKGENEILRHIQDKAMGKAGSDANRIKPGGKDPLPDDQGKKAIEQMSDEDFARMLNDPSPMTLQ